MSKRQRKKIGRIIAGAVTAVLLIAAGALGWQWASGVMVDEIRFEGSRYAELADLRALVDIDSTHAMLDLQPDSVAADVARHPWVKAASVTRWPTGTLEIRIEERTPVAIAIDRHGTPGTYLDAEGHAMPAIPEAVYDVPTISGLPPALLEAPIEDHPAAELLSALARIPREVSTLIGDLAYRDGEIWATTLPAGAGNTIPVRLGVTDFERRLIRMHTFWHRAILAQPQKRFAMVDLRFNSQVVTRESERQH